MVDAGGARVAVATWVGGLRHPLRAAGRRLRPRPGASERGRRASASGARSCWPSCCTASPFPALALFGWGAGFGAWYFAGLVVAAGDPGLRAPAGPPRRSLAARCRVLHHERGHERHRLRLRADRSDRAMKDTDRPSSSARQRRTHRRRIRTAPKPRRCPPSAAQAPGSLAHAQPERPVTRHPVVLALTGRLGCAVRRPPARGAGPEPGAGLARGLEPRHAAAPGRVRHRHRWMPCVRPPAATGTR